MSKPQEGDRCPCWGSDCIGHLELMPSRNCSCFNSAPCSSCMDVKLKCSDCGEEIEN